MYYSQVPERLGHQPKASEKSPGDGEFNQWMGRTGRGKRGKREREPWDSAFLKVHWCHSLGFPVGVVDWLV